MAFWDVCELNQLAEGAESQHLKHGKGWDCGVEESREELGWGEESETSPFGSSSSSEMLSAGC